jgi:uncharacterized protein (TIGR02453 family)
MAQPSPFPPAFFDFFRELREHNEKEWFEANRDRYADEALAPSKTFVLAVRRHLEEISPHFVAEPRVRGGSLFRIHTNRRFNPERPPYKTHAGIQFRHRTGGDVHAPGFYLHLEPAGGPGSFGDDAGCFVGVGIWRPDTRTLTSIREAIVDDPEGWLAVRDDPDFRSLLRLGGESLKLGPRGFDRDHPLIDDIKRKDFIAVADLGEDDVLADGFVDRFAGICAAGSPFVAWLCNSVGVDF